MSVSGKKGRVYLVGAGPGDPGLISVRGAELLKIADCVVYDKLANQALLDFVRQDAEIIGVPKRVGAGSCTQEEINMLLVEKAFAGKCVVRLKGGDPCIFGRGAEEAAALAEAGIDFEIVPGITAGIAAGEYSGIMLTDRNYSSQVVFVTGREAQGKQQSNIDWDLLARFRGTIVFYMGVGSLEFICGELIKGGMKVDTPAAVIASATLAAQRVVRASVGQISEKCRQAGVVPPAVIVIGAAARGRGELNWFMKQPLFGKNIVVTRDVQGNAEFAAKIIGRGGNPSKFEAIKIKSLTHTNQFLEALSKIGRYDWIVFTSSSAVLFLFDCVQSLNKDARAFASAKIAAIGAATAAKLCEFGIKADFVPNVFTSRELGEQLIDFTSVRGKKVLLLRSELATDELRKLLEKSGAQVESVSVYTVATARNESKWLTDRIAAKGVDWLTFASPSAVRGFFEQIPVDLVESSDVKVASIGPVTSEELKEVGVEIDTEAEEHTIDGLLEAIEKSCRAE